MFERTTFKTILYDLPNIPKETSSYLKETKIEHRINWSDNFTDNIKIANIESYLLDTDISYKRDINCNHLETLTKNFDKNLLQPIPVSYRNKHLYIIDGQHIVLAALNHNIERIPCLIYQNLSAKDEAQMLLSRQSVLPLKPKEEFLINIKLDDNVDSVILNICSRYDIDPLEDNYVSIPGCRNIITYGNENTYRCLEWVLRLIRKLPWEVTETYSYKLMYALKYVYYEGINNYASNAYRKNILDVLQVAGPELILAYGKTKSPSYDHRNLFKACILDIARGICTKDTLQNMFPN